MRAGFVHLGDVCTISGGYTPKPSQLFPEGDIPYFKVADMNRVGNEMSLCYTDQYLKEARKTFPKGAIVFPKNGGAVATNKKRILAHDAVVDLNTGIAIPGKKVDKQYLFYYFQGIDFKCFIKEGTLPVLRTKEIANLPFYFPPIPEQQRIVDILDQEFAKIDALKANAEKSLQAAKDLFQATLKKELEPKEGWRTEFFGEVCQYNKEQGLFPSLRYVGMENIEAESGNLLGTSSGELVQSSSFHFFPGDVLYGRLRPYLKKVVVADFEGCCSTEIFPIRSKECIPSFLQYWFLTDTITNKINATCSGCRMPRANMKDVLSFEISFPDKREQELVVSRIRTLCDNAIVLQQNYQKTLALCDDLKQSLLRKAFNGEL